MALYQLVLGGIVADEDEGTEEKIGKIMVRAPRSEDPEKFRTWTLKRGLDYILREADLKPKDRTVKDNIITAMAEAQGDITYSVNGEALAQDTLETELIKGRLKREDIEGITAFVINYSITSHRSGGN